MKNKFWIVLLVSFFAFSQNKNSITKEKFIVGIHYVGNLRNNNGLSDFHNGIAGIVTKYEFANSGNIKFQGGLDLDYLSGRSGDKLNLNGMVFKDVLIWNPNVGAEFNFFKSNFRPFVTIGYCFFTLKSEAQITYIAGVSDPAFMNQSKASVVGHYSSITFNPGARYFFYRFFLEGSYKYIPVESKVNTHFINFGIGYTF